MRLWRPTKKPLKTNKGIINKYTYNHSRRAMLKDLTVLLPAGLLVFMVILPYLLGFACPLDSFKNWCYKNRALTSVRSCKI